VTDHHRVIVGVHIDKARRQHPAIGRDCVLGLRARQVANRCDPPCPYTDIRDLPRGVAAIYDQRLANQRVVLHINLQAAGYRGRRDSRPGPA
jgi:hypothetical protein